MSQIDEELKKEEIKEDRRLRFIDFLKSVYLKTIILFVLGGIITILLFFFAFKVELESTKSIIYCLCDSTFVSGAILLFFGCFQIIGNQGTFDLFNYGVSNIFSVFVHKDQKKYVDAIDYKNRKALKRKKERFNFLFYFGVALIYLITSIILYIILKVNYNI